jgi:integrase
MPRKRGHGEGTIFERPDGRWVASVSLGYVDGKRKRKTIYGKTRKEVAGELTKILREQQLGGPQGSKQTLAEWLTYWVEHVVKVTRRNTTYSLYASHIRRHLIPALGSRPLDKLTAQEIQSWVGKEVNNGMAPGTIRVMLIVLRAALSVAVRQQVLSRNVASFVTPPRVPPTEVSILTPTQAKALLQAAQGERLEAMYCVALAIGLRLGEILGLRWENIDLEAGSLKVTNALQKSTFGLALGEPKTRTSYRTITLPSILIAALRSHRIRQHQERLIAGAEWHHNDLVFPRRDGRPLDASVVWRNFQALLERTGLPPMRFHDLRHSCVSLLAAQGLSQRQAMDLLGHATMTMTTLTYTHVYEERRRDAADIMDRLLDDEKAAS